MNIQHEAALNKLGITVLKSHENADQSVYHHKSVVDLQAAADAGLLVVIKDDVATPQILVDGISFVIVKSLGMITAAKSQ